MRRILSRVRVGLGTASTLVRTMWNGPYWWLVPALAFLLPAALLFVVLQAAPWVAPFVYTVF